MTKEELEKEAEEYALNTYEMCSYSGLPYASDRRAREQAYIAGAEPREERIAELEEKLANADYQLEGRDNEIRELKEQIEKMKCGGNCKHLYHVNTGGCYDAKCDLTYCVWGLRR